MAKTALILTRPEPSASRFLERLDAAAVNAVQPILSPLIEIVGLEPPDISDNKTIAVFSSANGVWKAPAGLGRRAYCVGANTTQAAQDNGWQAEQRGQTADELVAALTGQKTDVPLVHFAGIHRRGDIAQRLAKAGFQIRVLEVYDQRLLPLTEEARIALNGPSLVPLFSPRTAGQFVREAKDLSNAWIVAMSAAVAEPFEGRTVGALHVLDAPTGRAMAEFVEKLCLRPSLP